MHSHQLPEPAKDAGEKFNEKSNFIVLACDGVWDVLSDEQVIAFVREKSMEMAQKDVGRALVDEALRKGSTDNITVLIVYL